MIYTAEEMELLTNNVQQIESYLRGLMPEIRKPIHIEFGDIITHPGNYGRVTMENEYELIVDNDDICGRHGCFTLNFFGKRSDRSAWTVIPIYTPRGADYMMKLCRDWKVIKYKILVEINKQKSELEQLKNFEL